MDQQLHVGSSVPAAGLVSVDDAPGDSLSAWDGGEQPERTLMLAVLQLAVADVLEGPVGSGRRFVDARNWMLSDDVLWAFSFLNICETLDLDPYRLRSRLADGLAASPSPIPRLWHPVFACAGV